MKKEEVKVSIEELFRKKVEKDSKVNNGYLLVHSEKLDFDMNIAAGSTGSISADPEQPHYIASVGKLFTSTIISILFEKGELSFDDSITQYLDQELLNGLHIYKGQDYTADIKIKHLLKQTSGLPDNFWPLLDDLFENFDFKMSPREAIIWAKDNLETKSPPGEKLNYTDTNYHLLGLIIENITEMQFHEVLKEYIFNPLGMDHSFMLHYSTPKKESSYPMADLYIQGKRINDLQGYAGIDYAGGGVVATNQDLLKFMKALATYQIVSEATLKKMMKDPAKLHFGIGYGYGIWQFKTIPLLMPKKYNSWGCVGVTGVFMFYHPELDTYLIGNFNDLSYQRKSLRFMLKVIKKLFKCND
ncbi:beta-lactamase family protein [Natroniella sulfidigena]|uniref:serine hydrolase domain-containing protein n=1 Tax=Natroniella sulfidigena TaxID=723921 RepID=UPI00200AEDDA|nr:serine hydrolase [Natroniella sulfidigena]MCK8817577.1 beta-lactamase family protein [Natroniella sulfidigena]